MLQAVVLVAAVLIVSILFATKPVSSPASQPVPSAAPASSTPADSGSNEPTGPGAAESPASTPQATPAPARTSLSSPEKKARIESVLDRWANAARDRSAVEQINCYGPVVDTYFGRHHLTLPELRSEKNRVFSQIGAVERFDIGAVKYDSLGENWAVVSFDKTWAFAGRKPFSGSAREQVVMRSFGGEWKITSERELRVYASKMSG